MYQQAAIIRLVQFSLPASQSPPLCHLAPCRRRGAVGCDEATSETTPLVR